MRQMVMVGFLQAQNCTTLASAWRHPDARGDFTSAAYYQKIGQVLEEGKFQLAFFDDRLGIEFSMPSDKPGLLIRRKLMELLTAHGEQEVHANRA